MSILISILVLLLIPVTIVISNKITIQEYYSNFGKTGTWVITLSLLASLLGGWMFFGLTKIGYEAGFVGIFIGIGYVLGFLLFYRYVEVIKKIIIHYNASTMDQCLERYYGKRIGIIVIIVNFIFFIGVLAAQFAALSLLLQPFSSILDIKLIYWTFALSVIIYTSIAGFKGVIASDYFQFFLILSVLAILSYSILNNISNITSLDKGYFLGTNYGVAFPLAALIFFPLSTLTRTDIWQRVASSKNVISIKKAIFYTIPILFICYIILVVLGMTIKAENLSIGDSNQIFQLIINNVGNSISNSSYFIIFIILGIGSSLLSTIDTNISVITTALNDYLFKTKNYNEKSLLISARIISFTIGILGLIAALFLNDIIDIIVSAGAIIVILFPVVFNMIKAGNKEKFQASKKEKKRAVITLYLGYLSFGLVFIFVDPKVAFIAGFIMSEITWLVSSKIISSD